MLSGYPPFGGETDEKIFKAILRGKYTFNDPVWESISSDAKSLITKMMTFNPKERISAEEALNDPWFAQHVVNSLVNRPVAQEALTRLSNYRVSF